MMATQALTTTPIHTTDDHGSSEAIPTTLGLARHNTSSSTGSALRPPPGNWAINISGVCPSCHHHHRSLQVHVRISDDSTQVGDVYCKRCRRLWLAFGNANGTRLSLLSTISIEPDPTENEFRSTLIHMIRSVTPIAALSPTLTAIPEATSAGPSRETSVRSTAGRGDQRPTGNNLNATAKKTAEDAPGGHEYNKHYLANGRRMLFSVKQKARAGFFKSRNIPFGLARWFSRRETLESRNHEHNLAYAPIDAPPTTAISPPLVQENTGVQEETSVNFDPAALDVSASAANATDALASLKALDPQALQNLPHEQRISWARKQLTDFRARHSSVTAYKTVADTGNNECVSRRHSALAYIGGGFSPYDDWGIYGEGDRTLNGRPLSMSETHISEADTLVDGASISSSPRHIFVGTLHRDPRRSLSPGRLSVRSTVGVQDWSQIHQSRAEARRSVDSTATGGAVRSITTPRNHAHRLSRNSIHRTSSVYGTEPATSRAQLRLNEEAEEDGALQRPRSPSRSPPIPQASPRE